MTRLFCFPHAGASSAVFFPWQRYLPPSIQVRPIEYPGHGKFYQDPFAADCEHLVQEILKDIRGELDLPFAFYGHSMGGLVSFEMTRLLRRSGLSLPAQIFISGRIAPHIARSQIEIAHLPDAEFLRTMQSRYRNIPVQIFNDPELAGVFVPIMKADVALLERYLHRLEEPLPIPFTVIGGTRDPHTSEEGLNSWKTHTSHSFKRVTIAGDHFSMIKDPSSILQQIVDALREQSLCVKAE